MQFLFSLKTLYELETEEELGNAFVVRIPAKLASKVLSLLRPVLPDQEPGSRSYTFLRRFVSHSRLPAPLREAFGSDDSSITHFLIPPPLPLSSAAIVSALSPYVESTGVLSVFQTQIPLYAPNSAEQAAVWSESYWPCLFNPAAQPLQAAPSLHTLRAATVELDQQANLSSYFDIAQKKAVESADLEIGRRSAVVVVNSKTQQVVAVAGDARYSDETGKSILRTIPASCNVDGRPQKHALMQAIAMVAEIERLKKETEERLDPRPVPDGQDVGSEGLAVENSGSETYDSYLCQGLDIYLTHEPCVACAMAMVHSRFRACIFERRMPETGALSAEKVQYEKSPGEVKDSLGYGLFWRRELNWRVLAFQYFSSGAPGDAGDGLSRSLDSGFHA